MMRSKWIAFLAIIFTFVLIGTACEQKERSAPPKPHVEKSGEELSPFPGDTNIPLHPPAGAPSEPIQPKAPKTISIPDEVKAKWESVVIRIKDKTTETSTDQTIPLHSDYQIKDTNLTIKVDEFLPHFTMNAESITSLSNEAENPALKIFINRGGVEVFDGWLFERFPDMHPFDDERFEISLVGYNAKRDASEQKSSE